MDQHHLLTTFGAAAALGVFLFILASRIKVSAIVVLLVGGVLAGPQFLGIVHPDHLGAGLNTIISLAVGIILFEGGLTLDINGYRQVSKEIWGVLTLGVFTTWAASTIIIHYIFGFDWSFCIFAGSLIIVTGPTVIGPILRRIRVRKNLHHILHWEGVLIDPLGVFIALLCYEYFIAATGSEQQAVFLDLGLRFFAGGALGLIFGIFLYQVLKREWVQEELQNIFVLACAILNFTVADLVVVETGLLSVTIAGLVVGYGNPPALHRIVTYKVELKDFLIGLLFVLLAANLDLNKFTAYGWKLALVVAAIMFVVRPLNIFLSTRKSTLTLKEKLFLSWIAPRGIVAASMASVVAIQLDQLGIENAGFLETFTYSVIAGTVIFQGFTAGWVGKLLDVLEPRPNGWIIVGAHPLGRRLARFIEDTGRSVVLIDTNAREVRLALREGLTALAEDAMAIDPENNASLYGCGNFLALTPNENLNRLLCQRWNELLKGANMYRWEEEGLEGDVEAMLNVGEAVWTQVNIKPWLTLGDDEPPLRTIKSGEEGSSGSDYVLLSLTSNGVKPSAPQAGAYPAEMLVLQKTEEEKRLPVRPEWVVFSRREDLESLYTRMLGLVRDQVPALDHQKMLTDLLAREEEFTSLLGHGISMPHAYSKDIKEALLLVARPLKGIPCQHTGSDIELVFMLLSPEDQPTQHLAHISHIARLIGKETGRQALLNSEDARELYDTIARS